MLTDHQGRVEYSGGYLADADYPQLGVEQNKGRQRHDRHPLYG